MKKLFILFHRSNHWGTDSRRRLMENNNDREEGYNQADNPLVLNSFSTNGEQHSQSEGQITLQELAELLGVKSGASASEDGSCWSETDSGQQNPSVVYLINTSVSQCFPKPPADLNQNLQHHLLNVQASVRRELVRLGPLLESMGLMGCLIGSYHQQTFHHLSVLLQNCSSQNILLLMKWVLHTYLSQELLGHPDLQELDPIKKVDQLLITEWVENAKDELLEHVQKEVRGSLEKILQIDKQHEHCDEEACVGLYVDTIQCIEAIPKEAKKLSSKLSAYIWEVCFQELLAFVNRYTTEQMHTLEEKAKMEKPETIHFLKTLKICKELKHYVRTKTKGISSSILQEIVETLKNMEAFTIKCLSQIVADIAESHLQAYFTAEKKQFYILNLDVKTYFPKLCWCEDIQKTVIEELYKVIAHIYLKQLIQISQRKLTKYWSPDVSQKVTEDAELLHNTMSDLVPGVQQWNLMLLKVAELLMCTSTDAVILTAAFMQKDCLKWREDLDLLPVLLQWKGLSRWKVRRVLNTLSEQQPRPRSVSWYSCLTCWCSQSGSRGDQELVFQNVWMTYGLE